MRGTRTKRLFSLVLALCMVLSLVPMTALAATDYNAVDPKIEDFSKLTAGDTYTGTALPEGTLPDGLEWKLTKTNEIKYADATKCPNKAIAHTHGDSCYYYGHKICILPEHTHTEACYSYTYTYEWTLVWKTYTVTFNSNGGSEVNAIPNVVHNTLVSKPNDPTKNDHTFAGWYKDSNLTTVWDFNNDTVTAATTLYAKWTLDKPAVDDVETLLKNSGFALTLNCTNQNLIHTQTPTKTYELISGSVTVGAVDADKKTVVVTVDPTAYIAEYNVTTGKTHAQSTKSGLTITLEYGDKGWTVQGNCALSLDVVCDTTFYKVTFDADGGAPVPSEQTIAESGKASEPTEPEKDGYRFDGWYNGTTEWDFSNVVSDNVDLIAKWVEQVTVTFVDGGNETKKTIDINSKVTAPTEDKTDLTLDGWYTNEDEKWDFNDVVASSMTLTAKWDDDINNNEVDDTTETIVVTKTGSGTVTVSGAEVMTADNGKYIYNSNAGDKSIIITAVPADGSYLTGMTLDSVDFNGTFTASDSHTVAVTFAEMTITAQDGKLNYYDGMPNVTTANLISGIKTATQMATAPDTIESGVKTLYLARPAGTYTIEYTLAGDPKTIENVELPATWLEVGADIPAVDLTFDSIGDALAFLGNISDALTYYNCHVFAENPAGDYETVKFTYQHNTATVESAQVKVTLEDLRYETTIKLNDNVAYTYGEAYTAEQLLAALVDGVYYTDETGAEKKINDAEVTFVTETVTGLNAGKYPIKVTYAGEHANGTLKGYQSADASGTLTINKAPAEVSVTSAVIKYKEIYTPQFTTTSDGVATPVKTIQFVAGLDVHDETALTTDVQLAMLPAGTLAMWDEISATLSLVGINLPDLNGTLTIDDLQDLLQTVADNSQAATALGISIDISTVTKVIDTLETVERYLPEGTQLEIKVVEELTTPTNVGAYLVGAVTADGNYETAYDVGYLVITPNGIRAELDWVYHDENGIITLPALQNDKIDLDAYVSKLYEDTLDGADPDKYTVAGAAEHLEQLFLGFDAEGNFVLEREQKNLIAGAYTEVAYIANWDNEMYYAMPLVRPLLVVAETVNVDVYGDNLVTFDNNNHTLSAKVTDRNGNDYDSSNGTLNVIYFGVQTNGQPYAPSKTGPVHAGTYTVVATYAEKNSEGMIVKAGVGVSALVIAPAGAEIGVDNAVYVYENGTEHKVSELITTVKSDVPGITPDYTVISAAIADTGDLSADGLAAISGNVNVDVPKWLDDLMEEYIPNVADGVQASTVVNGLKDIVSMLTELGVETATVDSIIDVLDQLPTNATLTFTDDIAYTNIGAYLVIGMVTDSDHWPEMGAGVMLITPELLKYELKFNYEDDNNVFTQLLLTEMKKNEDDGFDLETSAHDTNGKNAAATEDVVSIYFGLAADGTVVYTNDWTTLTNGVYTQISYLETKLAASMAYAEPISRPVIITINAATVEFVNSTTDLTVNPDRQFVYDGTAKAMPVAVNGTYMAPNDALTVTYIGISGDAEGYYSTEAPTEAGVYTVIATYITYNQDDSLNAVGGTVGAMAIRKAGNDFDLKDTTVTYDGTEKAADITNPLGADYLYVAIDRDNNVAYITLPADLDQHIANQPQVVQDLIRYLASQVKDDDFKMSTLKTKVNEVLAQLEALDLPDAIAGEVTAFLTNVKTAVNDLPEGLVVFGKNPSAIGEYDVYALSLSANYASVYDEAVLTIEPIEITITVADKTVEIGENLPTLTASDYTVTGTVLTGDTLNVAVPTYKSGANSDAVGKQSDVITTTYTWNDGTTPVDANGTEYYKVTVVEGNLTVGTTFYTVTFDSNDGSAVASQTVEHGKTATKPADPTRSGYTFAGWYSNSGLTTAYDFSTPVTGNITLYAKWTENKVDPTYYEVTFHANGGEWSNGVTTVTRTVIANGTLNVPVNPTREGYTFKCWIPEIETTVTGDADYFAIWEKDTGVDSYTVVYTDGVRGETVFRNQVYTGLEEGDRTPSFRGTPEREGYVFLGWYPEVARYVDADDADEYGVILYTAMWEEIEEDASVNVRLLNTKDHVSYIVGVGDNKVNPLGTITRAEVANIFFRLMKDEYRNLYWRSTSSYTDVPNDAWYTVAVSTLESAGVIVDTYKGGQFRPNEPITRAELAVLAAQFCTVTGEIPATSFRDVSAYHWAAEEIALVEYAGWIEGWAGNFRPDDNLTRAECVTIVNRMLQRGAEPENMLIGMVTFVDNTDSNMWYYAAIQEAANSHTYTRTAKLLTGEAFRGEKWIALVPAPDWAALEKSWAEANKNGD